MAQEFNGVVCDMPFWAWLWTPSVVFANYVKRIGLTDVIIAVKFESAS
jgi:hypothetical protein